MGGALAMVRWQRQSRVMAVCCGCLLLVVNKYWCQIVYQLIWLPNRDSYNGSDLYRVNMEFVKIILAKTINNSYNGSDLYNSCTN